MPDEAELIRYVYKPKPPEPAERPPPGGVTEKWPHTVLPEVAHPPEAEPTVLPKAEILPRKHVLPWKDDVRVADGGNKKEGGEGNGTADGDGKGTGPKKSWLEKLAEESAYAGAIASQQFNENTKDGKQYGIPGGKNPDGPNHPVVQAAAGAVLVAAALSPKEKAKEFKKKLVDMYKAALKKGEKTVAALTFHEMETLGKDAAEELAKKYGRDVAGALNANKAIGPYEVMKKFTDKLGGSFQAHHILEESMIKKWKLGNPDLGPSIILSDADHKAITAALKEADTAEADSLKKLWKAYQRAYVDHPEWLDAIKSYFTKGK